MHTIGARSRLGLLGAGVVLLVSLSGAASVWATPAGGDAYVIVDVQCSPDNDGVLDLTLTNDRAETPARFDVAGPAAVPPSFIDVAPLGAYALTWTDLADGVVTVQISIDGVDSSVARTVECDAAPPRRVTPATRTASAAGGQPEALPITGGATTGLVIGSVLVAAGSAASLVARRRRHP